MHSLFIVFLLLVVSSPANVEGMPWFEDYNPYSPPGYKQCALECNPGLFSLDKRDCIQACRNKFHAVGADQ
ncbi:hypothetical protein ANCCAN_05435 [Ancylostoma caninum]|uniref:Kunitz/Bovine pancreatic trypsin inhibitor domain protein n=1 Tax=Ancylostoma caninum TaxID=29170 RepID=A0A368GZL3_ANCCA|nr:hypothetical protein ANCCAN_05435 [Ancylostoma caninum]